MRSSGPSVEPLIAEVFQPLVVSIQLYLDLVGVHERKSLGLGGIEM